jgi:hypothetical protein
VSSPTTIRSGRRQRRSQVAVLSVKEVTISPIVADVASGQTSSEATHIRRDGFRAYDAADD